MRVHYNYLPQEFRDIDPIIIDWRELAGRVNLPDPSKLLKRDLRQPLGVNTGIAVNNGTDALILPLKAADTAGEVSNCNQYILCHSWRYSSGATPVLTVTVAIR